MSKEEKVEQVDKYEFKLGMFIKINAPTDTNFYDKIWMIEYLDEDLMKLIDENNEMTELKINNNKFVNESIDSVDIIYTPDELGYCNLVGFKVNTWWSLTLSGPVDYVLQGMISNIKEDQIEFKEYGKEQEPIYIDFEYKGVPLKLTDEEGKIYKIISIKSWSSPEDIILKEKEDNEKLQEKLAMYESNDLIPNDDFDLDIFFNTELIEQEKRNDLTQGDEIKYRILQDDEQLYSIENQTADILNKELSKFITKERSPRKIKQINKWIIRYVELRELYSLFNENNNISGIKTFNHNYKPLILKLNEFKHNIPYIIPIVKSKLEIYDIKGMCPEVSEDALQYLNKDIEVSCTDDIINNIILKHDEYSKNKLPTDSNPYKYYISNITEPRFNNNIDKNNVIIEKKSNNIIFSIINNFNNFESSIIKGDAKTTEFPTTNRYNSHNCINSLTYLNKVGIKKSSKIVMKKINDDDTLSITGFVTLPRSIVEYSKAFLKSSNILLKSSYIQNPLIYERFLNKNKEIHNNEFLENATFRLSPHQNNNIMCQYSFVESRNYNDKLIDDNKDNYNDFLEYSVPKTSTIIKNYIDSSTMKGEKIAKYKNILTSNNSRNLIKKWYKNRNIPINFDITNDNDSIKNIFIKTINQYYTNKYSNIKYPLSYYDFVIEVLYPYYIEHNNITFSAYNNINKYIQNNINWYLRNSILHNLNCEKTYYDEELKSYNLQSTFFNFFDKLLDKFENDKDIDPDELNQLSTLKNIDKKVYELQDNYDNTEYLKTINDLDNSYIFSLALSLSEIYNIQPVDIDNKINNLKDELDNVEKNENKKETEDDCDDKNWILAKKFKDIDEIKNDNDKSDIRFDKKFDDTRYDIYNELEHIKLLPNDFEKKSALKNHLKNKVGLNANKAERDAESMVNGYKKIENGDYAVLDKGDYEYRYYKRIKNKWILEDKFNDKYIEDIPFCNLQSKCMKINTNILDKDEQCVNIDDHKQNIENKAIMNLIKNIDNELSDAIGKQKRKLKLLLMEQIKYIIMKKRFIIDDKLKYDIQKINMINYDDIEIEVSPKLSLFEHIVTQTDIIKKHNDIIKFCDQHCRVNYEEENKYWYYCKLTNTTLVPTFFYELSVAFLNGTYNTVLTDVIKDRGTDSDDGASIVDKHSGYFIQNIKFNTEEGYEKSGKKIISREVLKDVDKDIEDEMKEEMEEYINLNNNLGSIDESFKYKSRIPKLSNGIFKTMDKTLGITTKKLYDFSIDIIEKIMNNNIYSPKEYTKLAQEEKIKKIKIKQYSRPYKTYYYDTFMNICISMYILMIQCHIPHITYGKFVKNCVESFKGYPFESGGNDEILNYISCSIISQKKTSLPWSVFPNNVKNDNKLNQENNVKLVKKFKYYLSEFILPLYDVQILIKEKQRWLKQNKNHLDIDYSVNVKHWNTFLPPLNKFNVNKTSLSTNINSIINRNFKLDKLYELFGNLTSISLAFQETIQNIIDKQDMILKDSVNVPFLENACCNNDENNNTYEYFKKLRPVIGQYNNNTLKIETIFNDYKNLILPQYLQSNYDVKLKIPHIHSNFSETTIYLTFIKYCYFNSGIELSNELKEITGLNNNESKYKNHHSIEEKINILKEEKVNFTEDNMIKLLQYVSKENIIILDETYQQISPFRLFEKTIDEIKLLQSYSPTFIEFINNDNLKGLFDGFELEFSGSFDDYSLFLGFLKETNTSMTNFIGNKIYSISNNNKIIEFINNIEVFNKRGTDIYMNSNDETSYFAHQFLIQSGYNISKVFPNIILNKKYYNNDNDDKNIPFIKNNKKFSQWNRHYLNIVSSELDNLNKLFDNPEIKTILEYVMKDSVNILLLLKLLPFASRVESLDNVVSGEILLESSKYLFLSILKLHFDVVDIIIPDNDDIQTIHKREHLYGVSSSIINEYLNILYNNKKFININNQHIRDSVAKSKEKERRKITTNYQSLSSESRAVRKLQQKHKLGDWSKGLSSGIYKFSDTQYQEEIEQIKNDALLESQIGDMDDVTKMLLNVYDKDSMLLNQQVEDRISNDVYGTIDMADDDDYGDGESDIYS
tara:strand:+ start:5871 stop:12047 length:6177 start_codon:yes stop_codon:yes gene_type:complete